MLTWYLLWPLIIRYWRNIGSQPASIDFQNPQRQCSHCYSLLRIDSMSLSLEGVWTWRKTLFDIPGFFDGFARTSKQGTMSMPSHSKSACEFRRRRWTTTKIVRRCMWARTCPLPHSVLIGLDGSLKARQTTNRSHTRLAVSSAPRSPSTRWGARGYDYITEQSVKRKHAPPSQGTGLRQTNRSPKGTPDEPTFQGRISGLLCMGFPQVRPCGRWHRHSGRQERHQEVPARDP